MSLFTAHICEKLLPSKSNSMLKQASDLSEEIRPYIQHHESDLGGLYWPIVKIVRIKVPDHQELLQNIVLVDLPGNGDCNQTRDEMWKSVSAHCICHNLKEILDACAG